MRRVRQIVQFAAFVGFVALVWFTTWPVPTPVTPSLLLRLDPLAALCVALSPERSLDLLRLFWPALALVAATALLGRFFCGWLCPLGTTLDWTDPQFRPAPGTPDTPVERGPDGPGTPDTPVGRGHGARQECRAYRSTARLAWLKYALLGVVLGAAVFGVQAFLFLDPLCLATRTLATTVLPGALTLYNGWVGGTEALRDLLGWRLDPGPVEVFRLNLFLGAFLLGIVALGRLSRRFWCRNLCPLGALLGVLGRHGLWRRVVSEKCPSCRRCEPACPMGAIPAEEPTVTRQADCIQCYDCLEACGPGATAITLSAAQTGLRPELDLDRRRFLGSVGLGAAVGLFTVSGLNRRPWHDRLLRPPGAIRRDSQGHLLGLMSEGEFRAKCLRCGQCLRACPTGGLQPTVTEAGLDGFYTPALVPRAGWCEQHCNACGLVCPSGALIPFTVHEKTDIRIGLATIHRDQCLAWREGSEYAQCVVCKEYCSYNAIELHTVGGQDRPYVIDHKCVGCGICEAACPVKPEAAIITYRRGTPHEL